MLRSEEGCCGEGNGLELFCCGARKDVVERDVILLWESVGFVELAFLSG